MNAAVPVAGEEDAAYSVGEADFDRDGDAAVAVWRASLGDPGGRAAKFDWFYRCAPQGAILQLLRHGAEGAVVGTAGVGWRTMRVADRTVRAGLLADMAVASGHRLLGPALALQRAACERALSHGDLIYGFPNRNAVPVVKRLGYAHIGDMVLYVRALRHAPYLARRLPAPLASPLGWLLDGAVAAFDGMRHILAPRLRARWCDAPPEALPAPASDAAAVLAGERTPVLLAWRFTRCPLAPYRFLELHRPGDPAPCAWFACHRDGDAMRIGDFGVAPGIRASQCFAMLARAARDAGCRSLAIECSEPVAETASLHRSGFRERQRRPIYGKWRDAGMAMTPVRMTAFDEDE